MKRISSHQIHHQHKKSADNSPFEAIRQKVKCKFFNETTNLPGYLARLFGDLGKLVIHKESCGSMDELSKSRDNIPESGLTPCSKRTVFH